MKLQDQVITLEQAKRLKELGLSAPAVFYHLQMFLNGEEIWNIIPLMKHESAQFEKDEHVSRALNGECKNEVYPAYTVAELSKVLGNRMPIWVQIWEEWGYKDKTGQPRGYGLLSTACGERLIDAIESGAITVEQCNAALL